MSVIAVPNLRDYGDKIVNIVSMRAQKLYIPTQKQLDEIESSLSKLFADGVDLTNNQTAKKLLETDFFKSYNGYKELLSVLRGVLKNQPQVQEGGGGGGNRRGTKYPVWIPHVPADLA